MIQSAHYHTYVGGPVDGCDQHVISLMLVTLTDDAILWFDTNAPGWRDHIVITEVAAYEQVNQKELDTIPDMEEYLRNKLVHRLSEHVLKQLEVKHKW